MGGIQYPGPDRSPAGSEILIREMDSLVDLPYDVRRRFQRDIPIDEHAAASVDLNKYWNVVSPCSR